MKISSRLFRHLAIMDVTKASSTDKAVGYEELPPDSKDTIFRRQFKYYKQRAAKPDLSNVFDLRVSNPHLGIECRALNISTVSDSDISFIKSNPDFKPMNEWITTTIENRPGLYILSNVITRCCQMKYIQRCLLKHAEPPNVTNLSALGTYTAENVYRNYGQRLRWVTMGKDYNWSKKEYPNYSRELLPPEFTSLGPLISRILGLGDMKVDAVIINYYPEKATLSPHVDESERDMSKPLITLSLGQSAIYLSGGLTLNESVDALLLHSGDILVMHAEHRRVYHAVPRIVNTTRFVCNKEWGIEDDVVQFANECRINVTIRQVDSTDTV